ncbi:MAG TPA: hypothetical protein PK962_08710, partial [Candidatus Saccharicenans sp.]|nr:hypothetical protein [Candidatus Saccharicenans sp.]
MDGIIARISDVIESLKFLPIVRRPVCLALAALTIGLFTLPPLFAQTFVQPADPEARTIQQKLLR